MSEMNTQEEEPNDNDFDEAEVQFELILPPDESAAIKEPEVETILLSDDSNDEPEVHPPAAKKVKLMPEPFEFFLPLTSKSLKCPFRNCKCPGIHDATFQCDECNGGFETRWAMQTHISKYHKPQEALESSAELIRCPQCPRTFFTKRNQMEHLRTHSGN